MALDPVETRVLGCLLEKQRTTPDAYPLSLNSLRLACNQATNRDPVVDYDESTIMTALGALGRRRWIRSGSGHGGRKLKYRHMLTEELGLAPEQLALLAVMMLRGPQTPGELKQRSARLHPFADLDDVHATLRGLIEADLAEELPRRPGQKEERYRSLLGGAPDEDDARTGELAGSPGQETDPPSAEPGAEASRAARLQERLEAVERQLEELRARVEELSADPGAEPLPELELPPEPGASPGAKLTPGLEAPPEPPAASEGRPGPVAGEPGPP